jgi:small subunit ribosomal protein S12e
MNICSFDLYTFIYSAVAAPEPVVELSISDALQLVLKKALVHDGLKRGLKEAAKALDRCAGRLCLLASDCDEASYSKLVRALCTERNVPLFMISSKMKLGQWSGLCRINDENEAVNIVGCSCAVITDFGEETHALEIVMDAIKSGKMDA